MEFAHASAFASSVLLAALAALAALIGGLARRVGVRALGFWLFAWSLLLASGAIMTLDPVQSQLRPVGLLFSSLAAPLMAMGTYLHTRRHEPRWLIPFGCLVGVARLSLYQLDAVVAAQVVAAIVDPGFGLLSAYLLLKRPNLAVDPVTRTDRMMAAAFVLYAMTEGVDSIAYIYGTPPSSVWLIWIGVSATLFLLQIAQPMSRLGRREIERESQAEAYSKRLQILTEARNDFFIEYDEYGNITYVSPNRKAEPTRADASLVGQNVLDVFEVTEGSLFLNELVANGRVREEDLDPDRTRVHRVTGPQGQTYWFESRAMSYRTPTGELRIITGTRDITERFEQKQTHHQQSRRLNRAEELAQVGSWELHPDEGTLFASEQMFRLVGLPPSTAAVPIESFANSIHPRDRATCLKQLRSAMLSGGPFEQSFEIVRASDSAVRRVRVLGESEFDAHGRIRSVIGALIDVTEQQNLENRLRIGLHRFERIVDSNIVGVCFCNDDEMIYDANQAFLSLIGYSLDQLPLAWRSITPEDQRDRDERAARELIENSMTRPFERDFIAASGERVPTLIGCTELENKNLIVIVVDLSERKRAEAFVARYQRELEATVAERTRDLIASQNRLAENERLAAVGTLAAGVAHQINNPIGAILNSSEYALMCQDDEDATLIFERALRDHLAEARRCARIVRSMLQFSRDQPTQKWVEDLIQIARSAHRAIAPYAKDRKAHVESVFPDIPILVLASPIEIEQAIVNVLRNAIESREADAQVEISLDQHDKMAVIEIVDNGRGIDSEHLERLFDPFFSTRTRDGGTGLGLSVAHGVVKEHGGEIQIHSIPGAGTRVSISLPIASTPAAHEEPRTAESID